MLNLLLFSCPRGSGRQQGSPITLCGKEPACSVRAAGLKGLRTHQAGLMVISLAQRGMDVSVLFPRLQNSPLELSVVKHNSLSKELLFPYFGNA